MTEQSNRERVLAIGIRARNFSFVVFDGPNRILDLGIKSFRRGVNAVKIPATEKLFALFHAYTPSVIVVRELIFKRRTERTKMFALVERQALSRKIPVELVSPKDLNRIFVGYQRNKFDVALTLAAQFPTLASRLPPKRKCWQSEDYRMGIFDGAAVGVAYFIRRGRAGPPL